VIVKLNIEVTQTIIILMEDRVSTHSVYEVAASAVSFWTCRRLLLWQVLWTWLPPFRLTLAMLLSTPLGPSKLVRWPPWGTSACWILTRSWYSIFLRSLLGVTTLQAWTYYNTYTKDPLITKIMVGSNSDFSLVDLSGLKSTWTQKVAVVWLVRQY
jgi:hypothetical protein